MQYLACGRFNLLPYLVFRSKIGFEKVLPWVHDIMAPNMQFFSYKSVQQNLMLPKNYYSRQLSLKWTPLVPTLSLRYVRLKERQLLRVIEGKGPTLDLCSSELSVL